MERAFQRARTKAPAKVPPYLLQTIVDCTLLVAHKRTRQAASLVLPLVHKKTSAKLPTREREQMNQRTSTTGRTTRRTTGKTPGKQQRDIHGMREREQERE